MDAITLDDIPLLWRAESLSPLRRAYRSTGSAALDEALGGGWPLASLIEMLCDLHGIGELRLLMSLLKPDAETAHAPADGELGVLWLAPPFEPHAIALAQQGIESHRHWVCAVRHPADLQWAMTRALRSGAYQTVIAWDLQLSPAALRAIKLAAAAGRSVGVLFRATHTSKNASPATVRMRLAATHAGALEVSVLKAQGRPRRVVHVDFDDKDVLHDGVG